MTERDIYSVVKKPNRQDKDSTTEPRKRGNYENENPPSYALVGIQYASSGAFKQKENPKAAEYESGPTYAVVGESFPSSGVATVNKNTKAAVLEEEPTYSLAGNSLPSYRVTEEEPNYVLVGSSFQYGVTTSVENSKAPETKEDVAKYGNHPTKLIIALCITVIILLVVIIALIIYTAAMRASNAEAHVDKLTKLCRQVAAAMRASNAEAHADKLTKLCRQADGKDMSLEIFCDCGTTSVAKHFSLQSTVFIKTLLVKSLPPLMSIFDELLGEP
ncbi:uncharacterized protein LOC122808149 [Protopterus annectens]|uniref:uncharacterized protein LOC122808149 n=1 Tax=Protopterus annectens TaxID=7888 RepID=UPI001CFA1C6B|nr:uncharacterized protein LOC122808149 [Protopterus annectens]